MIPLASLSDVYFEHREGRPESPPEWVRPRLERAFATVSPLHRRPTVEPARVLVLAAEGDRITRAEHARRLQAHFSSPLVSFPGGHLLQFGRDRAFGALCRFLVGHSVIVPR
jgi:pimeloyl-ACP methyl ester carboxylesterase